MSRPTEEQIRKLAYEHYVNSGCKAGHDLKNWLEAERELRQKAEREETEEIWERKSNRRSGDGKTAAVGSGRNH